MNGQRPKSNTTMGKEKPRLIVDFIEVIRKRKQRQLRPNIRQLINQKFVIYNVEFGVSRSGEFAIVRTDKGEYITFSKVLIDQLRTIDEFFAEENIDGVFVKLIQVKNYLLFVSPMGDGGRNE